MTRQHRLKQVASPEDRDSALHQAALAAEVALRSSNPAMPTRSTSAQADRIIAILRNHEAELRQAGILHLSLFGSVARGEADAESDVDLVAELDPDARIGMFALGALERRVSILVNGKADLLPEPVENPRLRTNIERDRLRAF